MNIWTLIIRLSWAVLLILALVLGANLFLPQVRQYRESQRKIEAYQEEIRMEKEILLHLKEQQERLQRDPRFVEKIAREEYGLAKPGETVFKFSDEAPADPPPKP